MWYFQGEAYNPETPPEDAVGFVYRITNLSNGMMYIGKKLLWSRRRVAQKGKTRKRIVVKESDWRKYYGSNKALQEEVQKNGEDKYKREILRFCKTKGECSYYEAKEQFDKKALLSDEYYNNFIGLKVHRKHIL